MSDANEFDLDAALFMRTRRAVGIDGIRYYLTGVLVEPIDGGGAWIVATDGRAMLAARDASAVAPRRAVIGLTLPEASEPDHSACFEDECCAPPSVSYEASRLRFAVEPNVTGVAQFSSGRGAWKEALVTDLNAADKYPDWRKAIQKTVGTPRKGHTTFGIDPDLLARLAGGDRIALHGAGEPRAARIAFNDCGPIAGLIMPTDLTGTAESAALIAELTGEAAAHE